jgi:6-phosphogluconolactonase (cycloisomerase 2 family)
VRWAAVIGASTTLKRPSGTRDSVSLTLRVSVMTALVLGALAVTAPAGVRAVVAGGVGDVPDGCLRDNSPSSAADPTCGTPVSALLGAAGLAFAGRDLYVASMDSDSVVALRRSADASLHPVVEPSSGACVAAPEHPFCAQRASGMDGADAVAVSRDRRNVYVGSLDSAAVVAFARTAGGRLIPLRGRGACIQGNAVFAGAGGSCVLHAAAMQGVSSVAISPDGHFVYALSSGTSEGADSLVTLRRDPRHGQLSAVPPKRGGCVVPLGNGTCKVHAAGLRGASQVMLSPDGRFAYVAGELSSAVVALKRNARTGTLTPLHGSGNCAQDTIALPPAGDGRCVVRAPGLGGAKSIAMSPDGRFVYVASFDPGGVAVLARDPASGTLGPVSGQGACLVPTGSDPPPAGCVTVDGLRGATAIAVAPDGRSIYVATTTGDSVLRIDRDPASGLLSAVAQTHAIASFNAPASMLLTPDGRNLYLASSINDSVLALTTG